MKLSNAVSNIDSAAADDFPINIYYINAYSTKTLVFCFHCSQTNNSVMSRTRITISHHCIFGLLTVCILLAAIPPSVRAADETDFRKYASDFQRSLDNAPPAIRQASNPRVWAEFYWRTLFALGLRFGKDLREDVQEYFERYVAASVQAVQNARQLRELRTAVDAVWPRTLDNWHYSSETTHLVNGLLGGLERQGAKLVGALFADSATKVTRLNHIYDEHYANVQEDQAKALSRLRKSFAAFSSIAKRIIVTAESDDGCEATAFRRAQESVLLLLELTIRIEADTLEEFSLDAYASHDKAQKRAESEIGFRL